MKKRILVIALTEAQISALQYAARYVAEFSGMDGDHSAAQGRACSAAANALDSMVSISRNEWTQFDAAASDILDADPTGKTARDSLCGWSHVRSARSFRIKIRKLFRSC